MNKTTEALKLAEKYLTWLCDPEQYGNDSPITGPEALAAIREALAEPDIEEMTLTQIASRHEPVQEPVAWNDLTEEEIDKLVDDRQTAVGGYIDTHAEALVDDVIKLFKLKNAAPVRTKDLTDAHILVLWQETANPDAHRVERFARAVIAAFKEKNK